MVDDNYWLAKAKALVDASATSRQEQADKLVDGVKWLWTAYTASAIVGFAFTDKDYPWWAFVVIALPSAILPIAYASAVWVRNPVPIDFDERSPPEIKRAYDGGVSKKVHRLRVALVLAGLGTVAVIFALLTAAFATQDKSAGTFSAALDSDKPPLEVIAAGNFDSGTAVKFKVESRIGKKTAETFSRTAVASPDGDVEVRFLVGEAEKYIVTGTWTEEKVGERSLAKEVKGTKAAETTENSSSSG
jgi:hypothetical protein